MNRAVVFGSGVLYWAGVWVQSRRVRHRIGRSANVRPRGTKERLLWVGWSLVVMAWLGLPFLSGSAAWLPWSRVIPGLVRPPASALGVLLMALGYGGTLWCYAAMGSDWRMGINRTEATHLVTTGPFRWVRHPIYGFQLLMVAAVALLLPSLVSLIILVLHLVCARVKAADEEAHLRNILGQSYELYLARTGRWFPRLLRKEPPPTSTGDPNREPLKPAKPPVK